MTALYPRAEWTDSSPGGTPRDPDLYRGIVIHWPASSGSYAGVPDEQAAATLRGWRALHMAPPRGWSDIAYQYAITPAGTIWTLRGKDRRSAANGDDAPNDAYGAVILFLGPTDPITPAMADAVRWLRAQYLAAGTGPEVITHNRARQMFGLPGTECPGPAATAAVERGDFTTAAPAPPPEPPPPPSEEDDMTSILVRPGEHVRIPIGRANVVALAHDGPPLFDEAGAPVEYRAYVAATVSDAGGEADYKPDSWAPHYAADNTLGIPSGRTSVSPLKPGTRNVCIRNDTPAVIAVSLWTD